MLFKNIYAILFFTNLLFVGANRVPLDIEGLNKKQRENPHVDSYLHTKHFFDAVHSGKPGFEHTVTKNTLSEDATSDYDKLMYEALHTTTTATTFFQDNHYYSLDDASISQHIHLIDLQYIIDCNEHPVNVGDYYIGTSESTHKDIKSQSNHGTVTGFIFSRQATAVNNIQVQGKQCAYVFTELVHPIQIMDTEIVSKIEFPYNRIFVPTNRDGNLRNLDGVSFIKPDPPLLLCNNKKVSSKAGLINKQGSGSTKIAGIPLKYDYALDTDGNECLDAEATVPGSFNYNYASGTTAIKSNIVLGNGLTCSNCYSFLGAGILAVFNIFGGKMSTFAFEAKDAGGAGFNIGLTLSNPSFSGSKYATLAGPGKVTSIPITMGLSLDIGFGGAWATVKGSGSAIGKATLSSGYTLYEEDHIMYADSKWSAKHTLTNSNQLKPIYSVTGFKMSGVSLSAIVSVSAKIDYSLGGSIPVVNVGATIDFSTVLTATAQYIKKGSAPYSVELSYVAVRRQLSDIVALTHCPGDKIMFTVKYDGINPNENHELYFNLHHGETEQQYPIMLHKFRTTNHNGHGVIHVNWTIPYDSKFMSDTPKIRFSVHSSARLNRYFTKSPVHLTRSCSTPSSPIFQLPHSITTEKSVQIKWDKSKMKHFKHIQGTDGLGKDEMSPKVNLILVILDNNGHRLAVQFANNIINSGIYTAKFPDSLRKLGQKFFMAIHDSNEYTKIAWDKDHDHFILVPPFLNKLKTPDLVPVYIPPPNIGNGMTLWQDLTPPMKKNTTTENKNGYRKLIGPTSCPGASLSILLQIEFGFNGFTVLGHKFAMNSINSNPYAIIPQTNMCLRS